MDKVGKQMSIYMGVTLSLCLSLVGTLTSGHFTVPALLTGFVVGMVISIALGFVIPVKKLTDAVCEKLEVEENTGAGRCISALVSDVLYTPVITLAMVILAQQTHDDVKTLAKEYVNEEKGVKTAKEAIEGALDIIAEVISDNADYRKAIRELTFNLGKINSTAKKPDEKTVYDNYYNYEEDIKKIVGHSGAMSLTELVYTELDIRVLVEAINSIKENKK